jgi:hypothetical protein
MLTMTILPPFKNSVPSARLERHQPNRFWDGPTTSSPRLLKAWVVAEVKSGVSNEAEPVIGAIVRLEIVSELSMIPNADTAPPGTASNGATRHDRITKEIAVRMGHKPPSGKPFGLQPNQADFVRGGGTLSSGSTGPDCRQQPLHPLGVISASCVESQSKNG